MVVDEHPDLNSFQGKVSAMKDMEVFRGDAIQSMLQEFVKAIRK